MTIISETIVGRRVPNLSDLKSSNFLTILKMIIQSRKPKRYFERDSVLRKIVELRVSVINSEVFRVISLPVKAETKLNEKIVVKRDSRENSDSFFTFSFFIYFREIASL